MKVVEDFRGYEPRFAAVASVRRLIGSVPEEYLCGLGAIVLTNRSALNHNRRRRMILSRGKKIALDQTLGFYHHAWRGESAWIEIFLDGVLKGVPVFLRRIPPIHEVLLAPTIFHELGHHIHKTRRPEYRESEDVADDWGKRLTQQYVQRRYWYLRPVAVAVIRLWRKAKGL